MVKAMRMLKVNVITKLGDVLRSAGFRLVSLSFGTWVNRQLGRVEGTIRAHEVLLVAARETESSWVLIMTTPGIIQWKRYAKYLLLIGLQSPRDDIEPYS